MGLMLTLTEVNFGTERRSFADFSIETDADWTAQSTH